MACVRLIQFLVQKVALKTGIGKASPKKMLATLPMKSFMFTMTDAKYTKFPTKVDPNLLTDAGIPQVFCLHLKDFIFYWLFVI